MSTNPMTPQMPTGGDSDDGQCERDIDALQAWAKQVGDKVGVPFTGGDDSQTEPDGLADAISGNANPFLKAKSL